MEMIVEDIISTLLAALKGPGDTSRIVQLQLVPQLVVRASSSRPAG